MPEFSYRAVNSRGEIVNGSVSGDSIVSVLESLKNNGLLPVEIKKQGVLTGTSFVSHLSLKSGISDNALSQFCRQLSVVLTSGINLLKGLEIISQQNQNKKIRLEAERIYREIQTGRTLSEAMADRQSQIPPLLAGMVATGEASGTLEEILRSMAEFYEREHRMKQKIKSAAVYPFLMAVMALALITFFFTFVLPQITAVITASGGKLPFITRIVIAMAEFISNNIAAIITVLIFLGLLLNRFFKTPGGRMKRDALLLKVPLLGKTLKAVATVRFARTAYILVKSGIPLLQGLDYIKQNVNNALAQKAVVLAQQGLQRGESLAENLSKANFFDGMTIHMISIGEETGELERVLKEMAEFYDREAESGFSRLLALVEPVMLLIIGGIVSVIILSVMLPMMDMFSHIKR
ncbi:MAG: type II secretion system F family protein [Desulfotomaculum sp.]|nr:type II secretion system F family protein [Desulfotomaculum sp.]